MRNGKLAAALQIAHILCCLCALLLMAVYPHFPQSQAGWDILYAGMALICGCTVIPVGLVGCVMQAIRCLRFRKQEGAPAPAGLIAWAVAGPVVCAALWLAAIIVFVETTGGV